MFRGGFGVLGVFEGYMGVLGAFEGYFGEVWWGRLGGVLWVLGRMRGV